ncbi:MAG TPA: DUF1616 domain-containing protein [Dehalococcoidia bacterium]|nr:DUF1616 domain-containing protein [Dehalococcoidia bacterium]
MDWLSPLRQIFDFFLPFLDRLPAIRAFLAFILVFLLPGFAWTLILFRGINILERIALSFGLSIALVTLSLLALNLLFGVRITGLNALLVIAVVTIIPVAFHYLKKVISRAFGKLLP